MTGRAALQRIGFLSITMLAVTSFAAAQDPQIAGIRNCAPFSPTTGDVARGELISIFGSNLANGVASAFYSRSPILTLAGASVSIGGLPAPIVYASPTQLNVQVPFEIPAGVPSVNVIVSAGSMTSAPMLMSVVTAEVGLFYLEADSTIFRPSQANTVTAEARSGTALVLVASGLGPISPAVTSGIVPLFGTSIASATPWVTIDGAAVQVLSATYVGLGVYAITVDVPSGANSGSVKVQVGGGDAAAGPAGPTGPPGTTGPAGPTGRTGPQGSPGVAGGPGPQGFSGPQGVIGPMGPAGLHWQAAWSSATNYKLNAAVSFQGSSYVSLQPDNLNKTPGTGSTFWSLLAQVGATGAGSTGQAGPRGPTGGTGPQGNPGVTGGLGPRGFSGLQGTAGVTGPIGPAGFNWRQSWSSATTYTLNDAVSFGGSSYVSLQADNLNNTPGSSSTFWSLLAQVGDTGVGSTGPAGPVGGPGPQGPIGVAGGQGPQGSLGPQGIQGVSGSIGPAGLNWQAAWSSEATYNLNDAVSFTGSSYISLQANNLNNTPASSPTFWSLLAQVGATGAGSTGPAGPAGGPGPLGPMGVAGGQGPQGPLGPQGIQGVSGSTGPAGLNWRAAWSSATTYNLNDAVSFTGSSYISLQANNLNNTPASSPTFWSLLAQVGATGAGSTGPAGPDGPTGPQGPMGVAGVQGPQGSLGPQGIQGVSGSIGPAGLNWRAAWSSATTYNLNDAASFTGSSYISLQANNLNNTPASSPTFWSLLAQVGATGASGGMDFSDFFALMPPDNAATVAPGTDVSFPQDGPTSGIIARTGPSSYMLPAIGVYQVMFQVSVTEAGQLILTLNGSDLAYTVVGRATGTDQIVGQSLVQTTGVDSIITVRNPAGNSTALTITPLAGGTRPISAHLVIMRIQ